MLVTPLDPRSRRAQQKWEHGFWLFKGLLEDVLGIGVLAWVPYSVHVSANPECLLSCMYF